MGLANLTEEKENPPSTSRVPISQHCSHVKKYQTLGQVKQSIKRYQKVTPKWLTLCNDIPEVQKINNKND